MSVERFAFGIDRVDDNDLAAHDQRLIDDRAGRAYEKLRTKSLTVQVLAQGQLGEQDHGDLARP